MNNGIYIEANGKVVLNHISKLKNKEKYEFAIADIDYDTQVKESIIKNSLEHMYKGYDGWLLWESFKAYITFNNKRKREIKNDKGKFTCLELVATVLNECENGFFDKHPSVVNFEDIINHPRVNITFNSMEDKQ